MSKRIIIFIFVLAFAGFFISFTPVFAQLPDETETLGGLVPCGNILVDKDGKSLDDPTADHKSNYKIANPCNFNYFLILINKIVNFILFVFFIPMAAIMFCYAGFLLLFSGGESSKLSKAKSIFWNVVIGLVFAAGAWLIIHTISDILGYDGSWIGF